MKLEKGRKTDVTEADTNGQKHSESKAGYNIQNDVFKRGIGNAETDKCAGDTESGNGNTPDERG